MDSKKIKDDFSLLEKNEYVEKWLDWVNKIPRKEYKSKKRDIIYNSIISDYFAFN